VCTILACALVEMRARHQTIKILLADSAHLATVLTVCRTEDADSPDATPSPPARPELREWWGCGALGQGTDSRSFRRTRLALDAQRRSLALLASQPASQLASQCVNSVSVWLPVLNGRPSRRKRTESESVLSPGLSGASHKQGKLM